MAEYIEREKAIAEIKNYALDAYDIDLDDSEQFAGNSTGEKHCEGLYEATEILEEVPTADVVEVKHGKWKKQQFIGRSGFFSVKDFTCSNCFENFAVEQGKGLMNYCPNCGARMERENNEKIY